MHYQTRSQGFRRQYLAIGLCLLAFSLAGLAQAAPNTAPSVAEILAKTPEAEGIFVAMDGGAARHVQSGLICPLSFPNVNLWHLTAFATDGTDVGCDYGRNGSDDTWRSKLSIYAVKAQPDDTVETAFARYQAEVKDAWPDATARGPAIRFEGDVSAEMKAVRSEEYEITFNGKRCVSDLIVALKAGWIIEIRGTTMTDVANSDEGAKAIAGLAAPSIALTEALSSLTPAKAN